MPLMSNVRRHNRRRFRPPLYGIMNDTSSAVCLDVTALAVRTLALYSLAEFQSGHASTLRITAEGASFSITDDGRGHAIGRMVAGAPYLQFIYTQLDYPFGATEGGPVQLHGIGMSLLNGLCSELSVTVRKTEGQLRLTYRGGHLLSEEHLDLPSAVTGNTVVGTVNPDLQGTRTDAQRIEQWLLGVLASNPDLKLHFNGKELQLSARDAA
jgi:DNA gyrase/topoisomerase IV subunit B